MTEDTVAVSWEPVRAAIDKYVVRYTSADGEARDTAVPGERNSTVLTGLKPGEAYRVYVWAARGRQESRKADTRALTGTGAGAPGAGRGRGRLPLPQDLCPPSRAAFLCRRWGGACKSAVEVRNSGFPPKARSRSVTLSFPLSTLKRKRPAFLSDAEGRAPLGGSFTCGPLRAEDGFLSFVFVSGREHRTPG